MSDDLTQEDALAMLEFHSLIHHTETIGLSIASFGLGLGVGLKLSQVSIFTPAGGYVAAGLLMVLGGLLAVFGPRILLKQIQGGDA
ncbi:hypothetical protein HWV23_02620 [Natronomonas halophila]|uniref:hypothetical protein n=1 Tax=Natronomonas halophila TaxID=2747817 RepID=UPI0015B58140|nr:hypothetical protein [Natronomonas halophila]QLD84594.1 hypothetical protein HWV23_02335 [Natronomonas halophila]QLD84650.1 hypothetical protein HWV23_02620 [Natronomonas halophila]